MATRGDTTGVYTVQQAANQLGISVEAVRQRIRRNTLRSTKREGRVYVHLDADQTRVDDIQDSDQTALLEALRAQVEQLQQQLERADERDRENRRLLAAALERIPPQLEGGTDSDRSSEARERPETPSDAPGKGMGRESQGEASARPWWRQFWR
jgi:excisionase family DNA binding protein